MPPKRPQPPDPPPADDGSLEIDIDPELLEAALASVEKHLHHKAPPPPVREVNLAEEDVELEVEDDAPTAERRAEVDATVRLQVQLRDTSSRARHLEDELLRMTKLRDQAEDQLRDVRKAAREAQADFDRIRVRARKDREDAERVTEERLLREVLETGDNLERAWQHAMSDPESLLGGLQMIVEQFRGVLRRVGVERINATPGTAFDPEIHEAVMHVRTEALAPGAVVDEVSPGYRLRGRLFRPARVTVAAPN